MATKRNTKKTTEIEYRIAESGGIVVLEKHITTANDVFDMYDIKISNGIIIKDCRVVEGKNGDFIGTPSKKSGDNYYPVVYLNDKITTAILDIINDGRKFEATDEKILSFEKTKNRKRKDEDEDEDDYAF